MPRASSVEPRPSEKHEIGCPNQRTGGLLALAEHPDAYALLRAGEVELPSLVDELLRRHPHARLQLRVLYGEAPLAFPVLRAAGPARRLASNFINGLKSLPVQVT